MYNTIKYDPNSFPMSISTLQTEFNLFGKLLNFSLIELSELVIRTTERHYLKNLYKEEILFSQLKLCFLFAENIY